MISHGKDIKIFTGNANTKLAEDICQMIGTKLGEAGAYIETVRGVGYRMRDNL